MAGDGRWQCAACGQRHEGLATVFGPSAPEYWLAATDEQRDLGELSDDQCVLPLDDARFYFVRGHLELRVTDRPGTQFVWSVWVSLSEASMIQTIEHWDDPERASSVPPVFGWLSTELPYPAGTLSLPTNVHTRAVGVVPRIDADPSLDHALAIEQRTGITWHRVAELNDLLTGGG